MCSDSSSIINLLNQPGTVYLDGAGTRADESRSLLFHSPGEVLVARAADDVDKLLAEVDGHVARGRSAAGYLTYEAGEALVLGDVRERSATPLAWFGIYEGDGLEVPFPQVGAAAVTTAIDLRPEWDEYERRFGRVKHHIHEGDVYQINLTGRGHFRWSGDPIALYNMLRLRQPVAFGAYINTGRSLILSLSPELFFSRIGDRIVTRPMKGTAARLPGGDDLIARDYLRSDAKNRAENLMIVDLLRNDLSMVCDAGSVQTTSLFDVEPLPTVWQMTSQVEGRLRRGVGYREILHALFPCGSITGAPKRRAMQIIREIEDEPRGVYCGGIGYMRKDAAAFNVAIRTAALRGDRGIIGSGGGVVSDARAEAEFEEMHLKTRFFSLIEPEMPADDFHLIETMRVEGTTVWQLQAHLARLERSARYFGFTMAHDEVERAVLDATIEESGRRALRLSLFATGEFKIETREAPAWPRPFRLGLYPRPVVSTDPGLYHKTNRREHFDDALRWAKEHGLDDAILSNERGEVTETTRGNLFFRRGSTWLTPNLMGGLLPGIFRSHFMEDKPAEEVRLRTQELQEVDEILVGNAVRGAATADLVEV